MRNYLVSIVLVSGCSFSVKGAPDAAAGAVTDLAPASSDGGARDGAARDGGCGDGNCGAACAQGAVVGADGTCQPAQTPQACAAANREFLSVGVLGYCGACLAGTEETLGG